MTWFYCTLNRRGGCQRTLELSLTPGPYRQFMPIGLQVNGYDDNGDGIPIEGTKAMCGEVMPWRSEIGETLGPA